MSIPVSMSVYARLSKRMCVSLGIGGVRKRGRWPAASDGSLLGSAFWVRVSNYSNLFSRFAVYSRELSNIINNVSFVMFLSLWDTDLEVGFGRARGGLYHRYVAG